MLWSAFDQAVEQISTELKQHYRVEGLEDVRVIRDRQTSMKADLRSLLVKTDFKQDYLVNSASSVLQPYRRHRHLWNATTLYYISMGTAHPLEVTRLLRFA
jgi:hypothetical protein